MRRLVCGYFDGICCRKSGFCEEWDPMVGGRPREWSRTRNVSEEICLVHTVLGPAPMMIARPEGGMVIYIQDRR